MRGGLCSQRVRHGTSCVTNRCGLHANGPYPNYVIGTLAHVGTDADVTRVFDWAKHHGYWQSLPDSVSPYLQDVALVTIRLPRAVARSPVTVFVTRQELRGSPYRVGDPANAMAETPTAISRTMMVRLMAVAPCARRDVHWVMPGEALQVAIEVNARQPDAALGTGTV